MGKVTNDTMELMFKYIIMIIAIIGATILGAMFDGDYLTYAFIFYAMIISFATGQTYNQSKLTNMLTSKFMPNENESGE